MALRVLLADESVTIKKVFQLSLQDYGADVVTVTVGLDVIPVAKKTKPDIIFADVLLQKKSGYDVASEVRKDPELKSIPVVLIWSGFLELDEARFKASGAAAHLEKPFDTEKLRQVVQSLVSKTKNQSLSEFLQFPKLPDFQEEAPPAVSTSKTPPTPNVVPLNPASPSPRKEDDEQLSPWTMENFEPLQVPDDEVDEFVPVELPPTPSPSKKQLGKPASAETDESDNEWIQKTLSTYKVHIKSEDEDEPAINFQQTDEELDPDTIIRNELTNATAKSKAPVAEEDDEMELDLGSTDIGRADHIPQLNEKQLEAIIRAQSKELIEKVVWQVVPEIASQIIEREIKKLLKERDEIGPR